MLGRPLASLPMPPLLLPGAPLCPWLRACYTLRQETMANDGGGTPMRRRDLLNAGLAATAVLAAPRIARADTAKTLRFVPTSDLAVLDPVVTFNRPTRNYAYLVFDTLYGIDTSWQAQPQMVAGHEVDDDGLTWNLRLREGLRFHDKAPVLAPSGVPRTRRPYRAVPPEAALPASAGGAGGARRHGAGDHAGAARHDLALPTGQRS